MTQLLAGDLRTLGFKEVAIVPTRVIQALWASTMRAPDASRLHEVVFNKHGATPAVTVRSGAAHHLPSSEIGLGLPWIMGGLGHGGGAHAPNEYMLIEPRAGSRAAGLADVEKFYVDFLYAFGWRP